MIVEALAGIALLFALLLFGLPVAFSLLAAGTAGIWMAVGTAPLLGVLKSAPYEHVASYTLSTLPMFILMAEYLTAGRFTRDIFNLAYAWMGHLRGGVSYAAVAGGVILAAISGSSTAAASTLAGAAYPEMRRYGYQSGFATATLAVVGTLAIMIPPSLGLVLYGLFTETSVGRLLVAGLLPGVVTGLGYVLTIHLMVRRRPAIAPTAPEPASAGERLAAVRAVWPVLLLLGAMVFALYSGIITPTEVGAVGALLALLLALAARRGSLRDLADATMRGARVSAMVMTIVAFAAVFGVFLTMTGVTADLIEAIRAAGVDRWLVLAMVLLLLLVLGFFLDQLAILLLTLPLTFPLLTGLGYDAVWMGVVFVKTAEIGLVTPPMGMNVFVVSGVTKVPVAEVYRGVWPFVATELVVLALLVLLPDISTFLPAVLFG